MLSHSHFMQMWIVTVVTQLEIELNIVHSSANIPISDLVMEGH